MRIAALCFALVFLSLPSEGARQSGTLRPFLGAALAVKGSPSGARFLFVIQVHPGGPAHAAGLRPGDLITHINLRPVTLRNDLGILEFVSTLRRGDPLRLTVVRQGLKTERRMRVGRLPQELEGAWKASFERAAAARAAAAERSP
jgi:S1-C subfamily serine protease